MKTLIAILLISASTLLFTYLVIAAVKLEKEIRNIK